MPLFDDFIQIRSELCCFQTASIVLFFSYSKMVYLNIYMYWGPKMVPKFGITGKLSVWWFEG